VTRARGALPAIALAVLLLAGCGGRPQEPLHPARGQVFVAGKPAAGALVVLHPVAATDPEAPRPSARVEPDGSFVLSTRAPKDGAPAGEYVVAIAWTGTGAKPDPVTGEVPMKLAPRYADPTTSPLRAQIRTGPNDLPAFKLGK
jgi:hypothetical protein